LRSTRPRSLDELAQLLRTHAALFACDDCTFVDQFIARRLHARGGLEEQIDKNPKLAQAWGLKDKIYLAQRDFMPAKADFLQPIELDPKLEGAYLLLGRRFRPKS
jgi:tetratricopeptide (TPR) repeat protein